jgi:hypothetical protein
MWQHIEFGSLISAFLGGAAGAASVCLYIVRSEIAKFRNTLSGEDGFMPRRETESRLRGVEQRVGVLERD